MLIAGSILLVIAAGLAGGAMFQQRKLRTLLEVPAAEVGFLADLQASLREDHGGPGTLVYFSALSGRVVCEAPLTAEFSEQPCVYYRATIDREYEETVYEEQDGKRTSTVHRRTERLSTNEKRVPFLLEDATGRIAVNPLGARVTADQALTRFEPAEGGLNIKVGRFQFNVPTGGGRRTLGYRFTEHILPLGAAVYLHGEVTDRDGTLQVGKPKDKRTFFISVKDEATLIKKAQSGRKGFRIAAAVVGLIGLGLLIAGMV